MIRKESSDPRVLRTRHLLRESLKSLVEKQPFSAITVKDVTERAGLNRTTFYLHYSGLHELLEDYTRVLFNELRQDIYGNNPWRVVREIDQVEPYVALVFTHLKKHRAFYRSMLGIQGNSYFNGLFQDLLSELLFEPITEIRPSQEDNPPSVLVLKFYCNGFIGIAKWWLANNMPITIQRASRQITREILPGYLRLMQG